MKKILHLTIKKKWFDLIASGQKKEEYRAGKPYWKRRLLDNCGFAIKFDEIHFRNGYRPDSPFMRVRWVGLGIWQENGDEKSFSGEHGEILKGGDFAIKLGLILEVRP